MKIPSIVSATTLLIAAAWFSASQSSSAAQISNLAVPWNGGGIGNIQAVTPNQRFGFAFSTGATTYNLDSVVLEHYDYSGPLQSFSVQLYRIDSLGFFGNASVSLLGTLETVAVDPRTTQWPGSTTLVRYSSESALALDPATTYMIGAIEPENGLNETGLLFATTGSGYSTTGDLSVATPSQFFSDFSSPWLAAFFGGGELKIELNVSVVPEPGTISILSAGGGILLLHRRHRRATN